MKFKVGKLEGTPLSISPTAPCKKIVLPSDMHMCSKCSKFLRKLFTERPLKFHSRALMRWDVRQQITLLIMGWHDEQIKMTPTEFEKKLGDEIAPGVCHPVEIAILFTDGHRRNMRIEPKIQIIVS